jgi:hypothetical protein
MACFHSVCSTKAEFLIKRKWKSRPTLKYRMTFLIGFSFWSFLTTPWELPFAKEKVLVSQGEKLSNFQICQNQINMCYCWTTKKQNDIFFNPLLLTYAEILRQPYANLWQIDMWHFLCHISSGNSATSSKVIGYPNTQHFISLAFIMQ